ncbi:MAG: DUF1599 domain-containing protein [Chitinophagales bacterium]|nr:DUF1599 domain-containing protein [Chitinophagales bacterium]
MPEIDTVPKITNKLGSTLQQYNSVIAACEDIYLKKVTDYGTSWRMLRPRSLTDQIFIKAKRIRNIEETGTQMVNEGTDDEYRGIINYCLIALIQMELHADENVELNYDDSKRLYEEQVEKARSLMLSKNHDYGEAWRDMRTTTFTDLILTKLLRLKQIEDNGGKTLISEGSEANYLDIINYAIFALIKMQEA